MGSVTSKVEILNTTESYIIKKPKIVSVVSKNREIPKIYELNSFNDEYYNIKTPEWKNIRWIRVETKKLVWHPFTLLFPVGETKDISVMLIAESNRKTYDISKLSTIPKKFTIA